MSGFDVDTSGDLLDASQKKDASLTDFDMKVYAALNKVPGKSYLLKDYLGYNVDFLALNQPLVPIGQVVGFTRFTAQFDEEPAAPLTQEATTSTTYADLTTPGPVLTLPEGVYVILFGCHAKTSDATKQAHMSISVAGAAASDDDAVDTASTALTGIFTATQKTLTDTTNVITAKYRAEATATATFNRRKLIAIRVANT